MDRDSSLDFKSSRVTVRDWTAVGTNNLVAEKEDTAFWLLWKPKTSTKEKIIAHHNFMSYQTDPYLLGRRRMSVRAIGNLLYDVHQFCCFRMKHSWKITTQVALEFWGHFRIVVLL